MNNLQIESSVKGIYLDVNYISVKMPKALVVILHGMSEHKERYNYFLEKLAKEGYLPVVYDHRGHGKSVKNLEDLGYFYSDDASLLGEDVHIVISYFKEKYPQLTVILFSHSMGTLIARNYISKYDDEITKLILCGPPTKNNLVDIGLLVAKLANIFGNSRKPNEFLNKLSIESFNKNYKYPNEWLSKNEKNVANYNSDPLCGFIFTTNGFLNLFSLQKHAFKKKDYLVKNKSLDILLLAGTCDPVIISIKKFKELEKFLEELGYRNVTSKVYPHLRHDLIQEEEKDIIIHDILEFIRK